MGTARSRPLGGSVDRIGVALLAALVALAELGWFIAAERMAGMDSGPGTNPGALGFFLPVWVVGMAAMMFPSISPMVAVMSGFRFADAGLRAPR